jgi:hypothetical protein
MHIASVPQEALMFIAVVSQETLMQIPSKQRKHIAQI